jgi:hypothetical protein
MPASFFRRHVEMTAVIMIQVLLIVDHVKCASLTTGKEIQIIVLVYVTILT